jgi:hypothetical protein
MSTALRRIVLTFAVVAATPILAFVIEPKYALAATVVVLVVLIGLGWVDVLRLQRLRRDIAVKQAAGRMLRSRAVRSGETRDAARMRRIHEALEGGFPDSAAREAQELAEDTEIPIADRYALLKSLGAWQVEHDRSRLAAPSRTSCDIVFVTHGGMPGGGTAVNAAEISICRDLGLTVGLLHHPVYAEHPNAPVHPRIEALIDGESVRRIGFDDEVECALAVVRPPVVLMHPLERRPAITAGRTAVIADRTPFISYGPEGPGDAVWDIATVERHVTDWLGPHTWYAAGPLVNAALREHHAEEIADLDLAAEPWEEVIEIDQWRLDGRRVPDGRIRIGRHTRDHRLKWPEDPRTLLECYPERDPFEIHVLGGAEAPARLLDGLPGNWTVHPVDAMPAKDFLAQIDVMAYFTATDGSEAFGRAPLEAMAAGVPVLMDRRFEPAFGPAALYCEPGEVGAAAERLAADPAAYAAQQAAAWSHLADRFSAKSLMDRLPLGAPGPT